MTEPKSFLKVPLLLLLPESLDEVDSKLQVANKSIDQTSMHLLHEDRHSEDLQLTSTLRKVVHLSVFIECEMFLGDGLQRKTFSISTNSSP